MAGEKNGRRERHDTTKTMDRTLVNNDLGAEDIRVSYLIDASHFETTIRLLRSKCNDVVAAHKLLLW